MLEKNSLKKNYKTKYEGFTMIEMLITMIILALIFLAVGNVLSIMIRTSNTVSTRMLIREEGEFVAEVFRKYLRNSSADNVKLYYREDGEIRFGNYSEPEFKFRNYQVQEFRGVWSVYDSNVLNPEHFATEIHFRPSAESTNLVVCLGFFPDYYDETKGYLVRSLTSFTDNWSDYTPDDCFPPDASGQDFRKNFAVLNSDLVYINGLEIRKDSAFTNIYYTIDIDMEPYWGVGGLSNYRDREGTPKYRKSFVVQTRRLLHW